MGVLLDDIDPCSGKPGHVVYDTLDDRREVYRLLARLSPSERIGWLDWCCRRAVLNGSQIHPTVQRRTRQLAERARWDSAADSRLTLEVFKDIWLLATSFRVDFPALLKRLEAAARKTAHRS